MPQPTLSDVHISRPLSMLSVAYMQDQADFVASSAFPGVPVQNKSDLYFKYNRGDFWRNGMQKRAPGTPASGGGYKLATASYTADVWAEKKIVDDQTRANSDNPLNPDRDATIWLTQQALINREVNWGTQYFAASLWGTDIAGVSGTPSGAQAKQWNLSGSTPIEDILAGQLAIKQNSGLWPNTLVLGATTYIDLLTNAEIIDRLKYGQTAPGPVVVSQSDLAALFKVKRVLVMGGVQTTSAEDTNNDSDTVPDTLAFIGGKHALLCYAADSPGLMTPSAGYTFNWTGLTGVAGMKIKKFRWEVDAADHIEVEQAYAFGLVSKYLGYFFNGIVA